MNSNLYILSANLNSLQLRKNELKIVINQYKPHIICLQETLSRAETKIEGYTEIDSLDFEKLVRGNKILRRDDVSGIRVDCSKWLTTALELTAVDLIIPGTETVRVASAYINPIVEKKDDKFRQKLFKNLKSFLNFFLFISITFINS